MNKSAFLLTCILLSPLPDANAQQAEPSTRKEVAERRFGADHFTAGTGVRVTAPVAGDLIAAGGNVDVDADVEGDALIAGGQVRANAAVGDALYAAGGEMTIDGSVASNARIAGGRVEVGPRAVVGGNLSVAGRPARRIDILPRLKSGDSYGAHPGIEPG